MLALIMGIHIQNTLRYHEQKILSTKAKKDNVCGLTVSGMMRTLGTLIIIVSPGYTRLTSLSKTVREDHPVMMYPYKPEDSGSIVS